MIENYQHAINWELTLKNKYIFAGLTAAGFAKAGWKIIELYFESFYL